jgi:histidine ammonia-lyase
MTAGASARALEIGQTPIRVEELLQLARGERTAALWAHPDYRARLTAGCSALERQLELGRPVYGVTTGVGASVGRSVSTEHRAEHARSLSRFLGVGTGRILDETEAAAVVAARVISLASGHSGVRPCVLERLCELLNARLLPRIPAEGSVGASGDLAPLSYVAAALVGEREVTLGGLELPAAEALARVGLAPLELTPRETLSLVNGTSVMTALGCLALERAERLARLACALTAIASETTRGNPTHFDPRIAAWKPHAGQVRAAAWIAADLEYDPARPLPAPARLQDRYSIRCAPHVVGVLLDAAAIARGVLEVELNGANDNPLVDPDSGEVLHGGNFYGGHVCFALDGLKSAVASVADLLDRQLALLCVPETSGGLPENLVAFEDGAHVVHSGFKGMQIAASALTAEAQKLAFPAAAFSRSTESHNQDKVSLGTIAARDALRALELTETVAAIVLLAGCQALDLRGGATHCRSRALLDAVRKEVPKLRADRRQDLDIARVLDGLRGRALPLGPLEGA